MWTGKDESLQTDMANTEKLLAADKQTLSGMEALVIQLNAGNRAETRDDLSMQRYLQRLRKEGSGR